jgi:hypothetical protein
MRIPLRVSAVFALAALAASALPAQERAPSWGTTDRSILTIYAHDFRPVVSTTAYDDQFASLYTPTAGAVQFVAGVLLPSGAKVEMLELEGCDDTASGQMTFFLQALIVPEGAIGTLLSSSTGVAATNGCFFYFDENTSLPGINNFLNTYRVVVILSGPGGSALRFRAVRLFYRLQVSPLAGGPAVFNDVPVGHPFRRFIEALADAGITGGCNTSPPLFCPDDPITRGQMAVFLAAALGLHFPN